MAFRIKEVFPIFFFDVAVSGPFPNPNGIVGGDTYTLDFVSTSATDWDTIAIGPYTMYGGYYELTSQPLHGASIKVRLQTVVMDPNVQLQITVFADNGIPTPTNPTSGYTQRFISGNSYQIVANQYQFFLWGNELAPPFFSTSTPQNLLVSMLSTDSHGAGITNPVLVVGSAGALGLATPQLTTQLNWPGGLGGGGVGSGWSTNLFSTGFNTSQPNPDMDRRTPTVPFRSLRGTPLQDLTGEPVIQAPYVALSGDPNSAAVVVAGKLWDMVLLSGANIPNSPGITPGSMRYDNHDWIQIVSDTQLGDLYGTLWVVSDH